jgi:hypothetical protein
MMDKNTNEEITQVPTTQEILEMIERHRAVNELLGINESLEYEVDQVNSESQFSNDALTVSSAPVQVASMTSAVATSTDAGENIVVNDEVRSAVKGFF